MITRIIFIELVILCVVSCGGMKSSKPNYYWSSDLERFYWEFVEDAKLHKVQLPPQDLVLVLQYGLARDKYPEINSSTKKILGTCVTVESGKIVVSTNPHQKDVWKEIFITRKNYTHETLRHLMYHEMGHCYLNKQHAPNSNDIMFMYLTTDPLVNWETSVGRFFNNTEFKDLNFNDEYSLTIHETM